jgi:hypothetical protein
MKDGAEGASASRGGRKERWQKLARIVGKEERRKEANELSNIQKAKATKRRELHTGKLSASWRRWAGKDRARNPRKQGNEARVSLCAGPGPPVSVNYSVSQLSRTGKNRKAGQLGRAFLLGLLARVRVISTSSYNYDIQLLRTPYLYTCSRCVLGTI